jgi:hypothetical protein
VSLDHFLEKIAPLGGGRDLSGPQAIMTVENVKIDFNCPTLMLMLMPWPWPRRNSMRVGTGASPTLT